MNQEQFKAVVDNSINRINQARELALVQIAKALADQVRKEEPAKPKRPRAEVGGYYWFITDRGEKYSTRDTRNNIDNYRYETGNYYLSESDCDRALRVEKTVAEVRVMADGEGIPPDEVTGGYFNIEYERFQKSIFIDSWSCLVISRFWFKSRESAQLCIDTIGDSRLKEVFESGRCL